MKKLFTLALACVLSVCMMASCGGSDKLFDYNYDEYLTLGQYKGVEVSAAEIEKEITAQMDSILASNAYDVETKAAAVEGNKVVYSVTAKVDGAEAADLAKTDASITLGTGKTGLDDLDAALVGMAVGETKDVTLTVPADHTGNAEIDGKEAVLTVSVSSVTENVTPETVTDEMIKTATNALYSTVADYEVYLRSAIKQNLVWNKVLANTTFVNYPKKEAEMYYDNYIASYQSTAAQYGMTLESMASMYGMTLDAFQNNLAQQAVAQTNQDMAIFALAEKEGFQKFVSVQGHYNLIFREEEREMAKLCREENIAMTPYSALAAGRLSRLPGETTKRLELDAFAKGKYDATEEADNVIIRRVAALAEKYGVTMTEVSLAWLLTKVTSPVVGMTKPHHLEGAVGAVRLQLTPEDCTWLEEPYVPHKLVGVMANRN